MNTLLNKANRVLVLMAVTAFTFTACNKDSDPADDTPKSDVTSASDNALAENLFADVFKVVDEGAKQSSELNKTSHGTSMDTCAALTIELLDSIVGWPIRLTIDYGTGCTSPIDFRTRKGIVVAEFTGRYKDSGTVITITPQNYFVNDYKVEGTKTITNDGKNSSNNLEFTVEVTGGKITDPAGNVGTWQSTRTNEWIAGSTTAWPVICDDIYLIRGSASGVNRNGLAYTVNITKDLRKEICCRHISEGTLEILPSGLTPRIIDYGNGTCDGIATVTVGSLTFVVNMP